MKLILKKIIRFLKKIFIRFFFIINFVVILAVLALGYINFLSPSIMRLKAGKNLGLEERKKEEERLKTYLEELETMRNNYKSFTQAKLDELTRILPREEDFPGLFVQMQKIAEENNFILDSLDIVPIDAQRNRSRENGDGENNTSGEGGSAQNSQAGKSAIAEISGGRIKELNLSFSITGGNYEDFKKLLSDIERNMRIFDIFDIRFGSVQAGPFFINMRTYYLVF